MEITNLKIKDLRPNPRQPREGFSKEKIKELAQSIKEGELLQPIIVRKSDGNYQIIAGERRWRAMSLLGEKEIPAIVWNIKDDIETLEKSAIENLQREDLTSVEKENVIYDLWKSGRYKYMRRLAEKIGISERRITALIQAKEEREKLAVSATIPSNLILDTVGLPDKERKEILTRVEKGELEGSMVQDLVKIKRMDVPTVRRRGTTEITPESKEKYIYGKLVQSLSSITMLSIGWIPERVKLINEYSTPKKRKEIVGAVEGLVKKWTKILKTLKK